MANLIDGSKSKGIQYNGIPESTADKLESLLDSLLAKSSIRHAIMGVEHMERTYQWKGAAGEAALDGRPMELTTPYFIASIDKLFTAACVFKLVEKGVLCLETSISAYLPEHLVTGLHRSGGTDRSSQITLEHLLSHTSGLADYLEDSPKGGKPLVDMLVEEGDRSWDINDLAAMVREDLIPHFPPQDLTQKKLQVRYCDTNFMLLITILETVMGKTQSEVFRELLFQPFDMRNTFFDGTSNEMTRVEAPATLWFGEQALDLPLAMRSLRSVYSTLEDTLQFLRVFMNGNLFEKPTTLDLMIRRWNRFGFPKDKATLWAPSWPIEYGLGVMRFQIPRFFSPLYAMPAVMGHSGSTGSWLFYCPKLEIMISGTVDQGTAGSVPYRILPRILRIIESGLF